MAEEGEQYRTFVAQTVGGIPVQHGRRAALYLGLLVDGRMGVAELQARVGSTSEAEALREAVELYRQLRDATSQRGWPLAALAEMAADVLTTQDCNREAAHPEGDMSAHAAALRTGGWPVDRFELTGEDESAGP